MRSRPAPKLGFNFEYLMWIFTRISGVILILTALFGLSMALYMGARTQLNLEAVTRWTFFPNSYHVQGQEIVNDDLWFNAFWNIIQSVVIFFAGTHGVNGLRVVLEDYMERSWLRIFMRGFLFLFWIFMLFVSYQVIWTI
jgi:succinate dehydrogenase / fumarate reductase membrane anchor subunit